MRHTAILGVILWVWAAAAVADDAPQCTVSTTAGSIDKVDVDEDFFDNDEDNCCRDVSFKCEGPDDISPAVLAGKPNIVVVVADDQSYCDYAFMHGYCDENTTQDRDGKDCRSNIDCPGGECITRTSGLSTTAPLRLSEFTCRYRQPPSPDKSKACKYKGTGNTTQPDPKGSDSGDRKSYPFHSSNFPCTTTNLGGDVPDYPVPLTPFLDQLAAHGAVFPRAYVGGNACKTSRPVFLYGKPHRHLLGMRTNGEEDQHSIASWLLDNEHDLDGDPDDNGYWPFMVGKAEVMGENSAGFQGGKEKAKPKLAKYKCATTGSGGDNCRTAATAAPGTSDHLKVPYEARAQKLGIGLALDTIEGRRVPRDIDRDVILRNDTDPSNGTFDCTQCDTHGSSVSGCDTNCGSRLMKPFFLWFAPNQPHKRGRGDDYEPIFGSTFENRRLQHEGRITQADQAVGTLVDELKRHCICGQEVDPDTGVGVMDGDDPVEQKQSLWEHTVLIHVSDHGFLLYDSKHTDHETNHRTVMLVSEPRHRLKKSNGQPFLPPRQYPLELVHAIDVFRTVLDYAGLPFEGDPVDPEGDDYRFGRSLKSWVSDPTAPSGHIRDVVYGEDGDAATQDADVVAGHGRPRYLVTRAGLVGICMDGSDPEQTAEITWDADHEHERSHARPCFLGGSHDCPVGDCEPMKRCINDPSKTCSSNDECVEEDFCVDDLCRYDWRGSLGDMGRPVEPATPGHEDHDLASRGCDEPIDCVPEGVELCQLPIFKVKAKATTQNQGQLVSAWDLNWDPDERRDLLIDDSSYFGSTSDGDSLATKFTECLGNYWEVNLTSGWWSGSYTSGCAWLEPALPSP